MTPPFGPGWGNHALEGLIEISLPEAPALWPATPAWAVLGAGLCGLALRSVIRRWYKWRRDRYRRDALASLGTLRARCAAGDPEVAAELGPLLRAVALQALPRDAAASASGARWAALLAALAPTAPPLPVERLHQLTYADTCAGREETLALIASVERWVQQHRSGHA
jgi:hypothetical protein